METKFKETKIGRIPEEWSIANLSEVAEMRHGYQFREYDFTRSGIAVIKIGNLIDGNLYLDDVTFIDANRLPEFNNYVVRNGDLLMSLTGNIGRVVEVNGLRNPVLQNYRVGHFSPRAGRLTKQYLKHALSSELLTRQMNKFANQTAQANFGKKDLDKLFLSYPASLPEQHKIAEILSTVDESIEKTDAITRETQQLKKGLMQKLFTEGIGHTRFKETKIGQIPEEWKIIRLDSVCIGKAEYGAGESAMKYENGLIRYVRITDINADGTLNNGAVGIPPEKANEYILKEGDFLFARSGSVGLSYLYDARDGPCAFAGYLIRFKPRREQLLPTFLKHYCQSAIYWKWVHLTARTTTQSNINATEYSGLPITLPPLPEQHKIAEILSEVDAKIEKEQAFRAELEQLKKGLMQVLLTGKVRVKV